jgi:hypothetical protein
MQHVVEELRKTLPPVFAGTSLGELTGGAIHVPQFKTAALYVRSRMTALKKRPARSGAARRIPELVVNDPF